MRLANGTFRRGSLADVETWLRDPEGERGESAGDIRFVDFAGNSPRLMFSRIPWKEAS